MEILLQNKFNFKQSLDEEYVYMLNIKIQFKKFCKESLILKNAGNTSIQI